MTGDSLNDTIREMHRAGDWRSVIQLYDNGFSDEKLLWFHPESSAIDFLTKHLRDLGVSGVSSIGCGTGLLEWLINSSTGLPVMGFEIDQGWWDSKYSPPKFWDKITCIDHSSVPRLNPQFALLFCYFNDTKAFEAYLESFTGDCLILIGPDENNKVRYCDPQPFQLNENKSWCACAVWRSKFFEAIVVYRRSSYKTGS